MGYNKIGKWEILDSSPIYLFEPVSTTIQFDMKIYNPQLHIQGETKEIVIPLTDSGLSGFVDALKEIMKIPEASKILGKYKLLVENI